ncbi:transketolase [bacterium]|nr:MAG: transketolase [bacterium]
MIVDIDTLCINTIRFLSVDAVQKAGSGHPGLPLGSAPMAWALWSRFLKHNPANPGWFDRDRFVLSAGHGSMLLYSLLHLTGYGLSLDEIKNFRQFGSKTPGHPERGLTPGVETTTGPLGQGFGNAAGMAVAEAHLAVRFNRPDFDIINHYTYALVSDGDLMEGVASEAASLAGHLKLGKLILLYDDNRVTLAASTQLAFTESARERFSAYGWQTLTVEDGNDLVQIDFALREARMETERPSIIFVRTHLGYGSPNKQDTFSAHGAPLGAEEVKLTKERLGWPLEPPFLVPEEALEQFRLALDLGREAESVWNERFSEYEREYPLLASELARLIKGALPEGLDEVLPRFPADPKGMATRVASRKVLEALGPKLPCLIGGSADLNPSTFTELREAGDFQNPEKAVGDLQGAVGGVWGYAGRNLHFGVREHAMAAILNGMAAHGGLIPYGATFLTFSDFMRPALRLGALMGARVVHVFTHDSLALGEDGPTHQPVEHLMSLRAIPGLTVIRPCDANETAAAWKVALETSGPAALILTRQNVPTLDRGMFAGAEGLRYGGYVLSDPPDGKPELILIASGSEVELIVEAGKRLREEKIPVRLVSMPSWELFEAQPRGYRETVLPPSVKARLAVEAGVTQGWEKYTGDGGEIIGVNRFGASAPGAVVMKKYGFTAENVYQRAKTLLAEGLD